MQEIESNPQTPEQLLQLLDIQLAAQRARRMKPERNRILFLVSSVLIIMAAAAIALMMLEQILVTAPREGSRAPQGGTDFARKF
jgi:hypothetical protein